MKYIKRFEKKLFNPNDCKVGDYIKYRQNNYTFDAKIIKKDESFYLVQNEICKIGIIKEQILRFLTSLEIENFELLLNTNKFNI